MADQMTENEFIVGIQFAIERAEKRGWDAMKIRDLIEIALEEWEEQNQDD